MSSINKEKSGNNSLYIKRRNTPKKMGQCINSMKKGEQIGTVLSLENNNNINR